MTKSQERVQSNEVLYIQNMDTRKRMGRTANELFEIFEKLPKASFCFDIAHAAQVAPTMSEARKMLISFGDRIKQFLPTDAPVILEDALAPGRTIEDTIETARRMLC